MELKQVALVIVDISGYTQFLKLRTISLLHAEQIITALLEAVIDAAEYPLTLNKLEGDAAFLYAEMGDNQSAVARDIAKQVQAFFTAFQAKAQELSHNASLCACDACERISSLKLKAMMHQGQVAFKRIRQFEELAGEDVILVHRLLKNTIPSHEYILMTEVFYQLVGDLAGLPGETRTETYTDIGQ